MLHLLTGQLDDRTLIQVDATVIAGILILLTLSQLKYAEATRARGTQKILLIIIIITIVPFSFSALSILGGSSSEISVGSAWLGFALLIVGAIVFVIMPLIPTNLIERK